VKSHTITCRIATAAALLTFGLAGLGGAIVAIAHRPTPTPRPPRATEAGSAEHSRYRQSGACCRMRGGADSDPDLVVGLGGPPGQDLIERGKSGEIGTGSECPTESPEAIHHSERLVVQLSSTQLLDLGSASSR
jgi:hypothetical protein